MQWKEIGARIRQQREYMGYTREQFAELIDVTPKFCSDIELGVKGMSIPTLCRIAAVLHLTTDYILNGTPQGTLTDAEPLFQMLSNMPPQSYGYAEQILKTFVMAVDTKKEFP